VARALAVERAARPWSNCWLTRHKVLVKVQVAPARSFSYTPSMQADPRVLDLLNDVLTNELTAINQYFIHAKMCQNWGYQRLYKKVRAESIDEMNHADRIIERILFLDGVPNLQRLGKVNVGETVAEQFKLDLALEYAAIPRLRDGIELCRELNDHVSRGLLEEILKGEEEHADWLETQQELIRQVGESQYLTQQIYEN
jgi:bacterioferritin